MRNQGVDIYYNEGLLKVLLMAKGKKSRDRIRILLHQTLCKANSIYPLRQMVPMGITVLSASQVCHTRDGVLTRGDWGHTPTIDCRMLLLSWPGFQLCWFCRDLSFVSGETGKAFLFLIGSMTFNFVMCKKKWDLHQQVDLQCDMWDWVLMRARDPFLLRNSSLLLYLKS